MNGTLRQTHRRIIPPLPEEPMIGSKKKVVLGMWGIPDFDLSLYGTHFQSFCGRHYKAQHLAKLVKTEIKQVKQLQQVKCGLENVEVRTYQTAFCVYDCILVRMHAGM